MATEAKTPIHKHAHPVYGWIALVISVLVIVGVSGWYYLSLSDGYNDELVTTVQELSMPVGETSATTTTGPVDVFSETASIDQEISDVLESDLSDTQLDNTILGIN